MSASEHPIDGNVVPKRRALFVSSIGIEAAERVSYFVLVSSLLLYVSLPAEAGGLGLQASVGATTIGLYSAILYLASIIGGWLADRVLGAYRTLLVGSVMVPGGLLFLVLERSSQGLWFGLVTLAMGAGLVKSTTGTTVAALFAQGDPRRARAFLRYYNSLNAGVLAGAAIALLFVDEGRGFQVVVSVAAATTAVACVAYLVSYRRVLRADRAKHPVGGRWAILMLAGIIVLVSLLIALLASGFVTVVAFSWVAVVACILLASYVLRAILRSPAITPQARAGVRRYIAVFVASLMHVTLFAQLFTGISLYASQTAKSAGTALQVGILLGPLIAIMASAILGRRMGAYPRPARAYWLSMVILSATFVALMLSTFLPPATVVVLAVVSVCVFFVADLVASPTAIAFVTAVAPGMFASRLLSVHYVSFALGSAISGLIPAAMGEWGYRSAFAGLAASGLIGATLLWRYRSHIDVDSR